MKNILIVDDDIELLILKNPSEAEVQQTAIKKGMLTMYQDGLIKVLQGLTTLEEIERMAEA